MDECYARTLHYVRATGGRKEVGGGGGGGTLTWGMNDSPAALATKVRA